MRRSAAPITEQPFLHGCSLTPVSFSSRNWNLSQTRWLQLGAGSPAWALPGLMQSNLVPSSKNKIHEICKDVKALFTWKVNHEHLWEGYRSAHIQNMSYALFLQTFPGLERRPSNQLRKLKWWWKCHQKDLKSTDLFVTHYQKFKWTSLQLWHGDYKTCNRLVVLRGGWM